MGPRRSWDCRSWRGREVIENWNAPRVFPASRSFLDDRSLPGCSHALTTLRVDLMMNLYLPYVAGMDTLKQDCSRCNGYTVVDGPSPTSYSALQMKLSLSVVKAVSSPISISVPSPENCLWRRHCEGTCQSGG